MEFGIFGGKGHCSISEDAGSVESKNGERGRCPRTKVSTKYEVRHDCMTRLGDNNWRGSSVELGNPILASVRHTLCDQHQFHHRTFAQVERLISLTTAFLTSSAAHTGILILLSSFPTITYISDVDLAILEGSLEKKLCFSLSIYLFILIFFFHKNLEVIVSNYQLRVFDAVLKIRC